MRAPAPDAGPTRPVLGATQAVAANVAGVVMNTMYKLIVILPASEVIVLRSLCSLAPLLLFQRWERARFPAPRDRASLSLVWARAACEAGATFWLIVALGSASVTFVISVGLTMPLLVTLIGVFAFGERAGARVWLGVAAGFGGALLVVQPGGGATPLGIASACAAALCYAARDGVTRRIGGRYGPLFLTATANAATLVVGLALGVQGGWRALDLTQIGYMAVAIGGFLASNILMTAAVQNAGLVLSGVFRYSAVLAALAVDYLVFAVLPNWQALVGTAIIIVSGLLVSLGRRERPFPNSAAPRD